MKKFITFFALTLLLSGCNKEENLNNLEITDTSQTIAASIQPTSETPSTQNLTLEFDQNALNITLPVICQSSNKSTEWLHPKASLNFDKCEINSELYLGDIYIHDQASIDAGVDEFIANNGNQICIDGPVTCYEIDWKTERNRIQIEKSAIDSKSIPKGYDDVRTLAGKTYLVETTYNVPSGDAWRKYTTYFNNDRVTINIFWGQVGYYKNYQTRYLLETDEFIEKILLEMRT